MDVKQILNEHGPLVSTRIVDILVRHGVKEAAARQRISRTRDPEISRLSGLNFPKGEKFLYLKEHYRSQRYWESLLSALTNANSAYAFAIHSLLGRGGVCKKSHFEIISGSPNRLKGHVGFDSLLTNLCKAELVYVSDDRIDINQEGFHSSGEPLTNRLIVENILLEALKEWFRKTGLVSYERVEIRSDGKIPRFGAFGWDLAGPSYVHPFVSVSKGSATPGFIVADVVVGDPLSVDQIKYFVHKNDVMRHQRKTRPFMALLVASGFESDAFRHGRSKGLVLSTPENLLGHDVGAALKTLLKTLGNAAAMAAKNPEVIEGLFVKLGKIEGAALNLRGALFELLVGHCVKETIGGNIDIGREVYDPTNHEKAEIDVFLVKGGQSVHVYECRGKSPDAIVSKDEVLEWLNVKTPHIRNWIKHTRKDLNNHKLHFEFWTTGKFEAGALEMLNKASEARKFAVGHRDGQAVAEYARKINNKRINQMLNEHFLKHPLAGVG